MPRCALASPVRHRPSSVWAKPSRVTAVPHTATTRLATGPAGRRADERLSTPVTAASLYSCCGSRPPTGRPRARHPDSSPVSSRLQTVQCPPSSSARCRPVTSLGHAPISPGARRQCPIGGDVGGCGDHSASALSVTSSRSTVTSPPRLCLCLCLTLPLPLPRLRPLSGRPTGTGRASPDGRLQGGKGMLPPSSWHQPAGVGCPSAA